MKKLRLIPAIFSSFLLLIMTGVLIGFRLEIEGTRLVIETGDKSAIQLIAGGCMLVFFFQLFRNFQFYPKGSLISFYQRSARIVSSFEKYERIKKIVFFATICLLFICPFWASRSAVDLATLALIYIMLGLGLNIVVGLAGLLDLGYVGFYAIGAYSYALLNLYFGLGFWPCLIIGGLLAAFSGFLLGFPVLRLRGDYLAIVTLGFGEIIRILLNNWTDLTGGPNGISQIPKPTLFGLEFSRRAEEGNIAFHDFFGTVYSSHYKIIFLYLLALILVLVTVLTVRRLLRMPIGRAWEALREDEAACRSMGLSPTAIKLSAFTIGASFAGFAGTFFAARQGFISPESFTFIESAIILAIVVLGGMGSQAGVILAAIIMTVMPEIAREFEEYRMLLFGLLMVLMMAWRPEGLIPMKRSKVTMEPDI